MLRINEILDKIQPEYSLEAIMIKLKFGYVGYGMRKPTSMENNFVIGKIECTRRRGRPPFRWMSGVKGVITEVTRNRTRMDGN